MKKFSLGLLAVVGCASPELFNVVAVVPADAGDLYACAMEQLYAMDYFVEDILRPGRLPLPVRIIVRKQASDAVQDFFTGETQYSRLTVDIRGAVGREGQTIRVSAGVITDGTRGNGSMGSPSEETKNEAQTLLLVCTGSAGSVQPI